MCNHTRFVRIALLSEAHCIALQKAEHVAIRELGVVINVELQDHQIFLDDILDLCPGTTKLALVIPELPTSDTIRGLAAKAPRLSELTLCAYLHSGTWRWPDSAAEYGQAISSFNCLRKLSINHDDLAVELNDPGEEEPCGNFTAKCSDAGEILRRAFIKQIAEACPTIQDFAICPLEQEKGRLVRSDEEGAVVEFIDDAPPFFWEKF